MGGKGVKTLFAVFFTLMIIIGSFQGSARAAGQG